MRNIILLFTTTMVILFNLTSCDEDDETGVYQLDCNDSLTLAPTYSFRILNSKWDNVVCRDTNTGYLRSTSGSDSILTGSIAPLWAKLRSIDSPLSLQLFISDTFINQQTISTTQAYDLVAPGNFRYQFGDFDRVGVRFTLGVHHNSSGILLETWVSKIGDNTNSTFTITDRSAMYFENQDTFTTIQGVFCCMLYNDTLGSKPYLGNFSARVKVNL